MCPRKFHLSLPDSELVFFLLRFSVRHSRFLLPGNHSLDNRKNERNVNDVRIVGVENEES